jgi:putative hemolysin
MGNIAHPAMMPDTAIFRRISSVCHETLAWVANPATGPGPQSKGNLMTKHEAFSWEFLEPAAPAQPDGPVFTYSAPHQSWLRRTMIRSVERLSGRARFERIYRDWQQTPRDLGETVFTSAIKALGVKTDVSAQDMARIPATGPLLVVANHPYGIVDGLLIGHLISTRRSDVKLICHSLLCQPVEARDVLLPIDFGTGPDARRTSAETRKKAVEWLDQGHALIIFPAGGISTVPTPGEKVAADLVWHPFIARLARRAGVKTLAMYVHGQNSRLFQMISHVSYPLRLALIFHETKRVLRRPVKVGIADPVGLAEAEDKSDLVATLRARTFAMAPEGGPKAEAVFEFPKHINL